MVPREFAAMNASYEYGDFPVTPSQRECMSCKFAEVCPEAKVGGDDGARVPVLHQGGSALKM